MDTPFELFDDASLVLILWNFRMAMNNTDNTSKSEYEQSENPIANELFIPSGMMPAGEASFDDIELRELVENYGLKLNGVDK